MKREPRTLSLSSSFPLAPSYRAEEDGPYLAREEIDVKDGVAVVRATGRPAHVVVEKMSKSKKNGLSPDEIVSAHGADTLR